MEFYEDGMTPDDKLIAGLIALNSAGANIYLACEKIWMKDSEVKPDSPLGCFLISIDWKYEEFYRNWWFEKQ
jgi:hypothetical protein